MTDTHTPGPWSQENEHGEDRHIVRDSNGNLVADAAGPNTLKDSCREANARLITAAPDLLAALRQMMEWGGLQRWASWERS
jgi:hypothetical protein